MLVTLATLHLSLALHPRIAGIDALGTPAFGGCAATLKASL
jgi:hypothetical protein